MRYSTGAKFFISLIIFVPVVALWLLYVEQSPVQRWPAVNNKISCPDGDPLEVRSISQLDGKINEIVGLALAGRSALCITHLRTGEWDIYGGQSDDLLMQQDYQFLVRINVLKKHWGVHLWFGSEITFR